MKRMCCTILAVFALAFNVMAQNDEVPEISPNFLAFDEENWSLLSYDSYSGDAVLSYTGEKPDFIAGKTVTTLSNDTIGYFLRKITEIQENGNILMLKTSRADMEDVFMNKSFTLNTTGMSLRKGVSLRSAADISKALTDEQGHIHPVEYIIRSKNTRGKQEIRRINFVHMNEPSPGEGPDESPVLAETAGFARAVGPAGSGKPAKTNGFAETGKPAKAAEEFNIINIYEDLSDMDLYQSGDFRFFIEEGHLLFKVDAVLDFVFNARQVSGEQEIIRDGELQEFQFYLQGIAEAKSNYKMSFSAEYSTEDEIELLEDLIDVTVKFMVGPVPVWISFGLDIMAAYSFNAQAEVVATWGTQAKQTVKIGGKYITSGGTFSPIAEKEFSYEFEPLIVVGEADVNARAEIFPRTSMMIYSAAGPYCDVAPYLSADFKAKAMVSSGGESDLKWNSSLNFGIDFRAGLKPAFLECLLGEVGPYSTELYKYTIWESPCNIDLSNKPDNSYILPTTLPLSFKISDNLRNRAPFAALFLEVSHGTLNAPWVVANTSGLASVNWTLDENAKTDKQKLTARLINTEEETIDEYELVVHVDNSSTGIYIENHVGGDSLIITDVDFINLDRAVFSKNDNKAGIMLNKAGFEACESGLSGHYGHIVMEHSYFNQCPTAIHVNAKTKEGRLDIKHSEFNSCENIALRFTDFYHSEIRGNRFSNCNKAILGENGSLYSVMESTFSECAKGAEADRFDDVYIYKNSFSGKKTAGGPDQTAILITNNKKVYLDENEIQDFETGIYAYNIFNSGNISNQKILTTFNGFELSYITNVKLISNTVQLKGDIAMNEMDSYVGLFLKNSDNNQIVRNNINRMCTGIIERNCNNNHFSANNINQSQCDSTGLRSTISGSDFVNNNFTNNRGAALLFDNSRPSIVANNNFINNAIGIGNNPQNSIGSQSGSAEISVHNNYFEGQNLANTLGQINAVNNLSTPVSLVCDFPFDTLFVPSGGKDSLVLHVQNFADLNDSVLVHLSDPLGWISNEKVQSRHFADSTGTLFYVVFSAAGENNLRSAYTTDLVKAEVHSVKYGSLARDSIVLAIYGQELKNIQLQPQRMTLHWQDSIQFVATAYDQYEWEMSPALCWQSSAGNIDQEGWLRFSEAFEGQVLVTATDTVSMKSASTQLMLTDVQTYLDSIVILPDVQEIKAGERIQFQAKGFNQFGYPIDFGALWKASAGNITETGWFVAPLKNSEIVITACDKDSLLSKQLAFEVICMQEVYQKAVLCGDQDSLYISDRWIREAGIYHDSIVGDSCSVHYIVELIKADLPEVSLVLPFDTLAKTEQAQVLSGGSPAGGIYFIDNQQASQFDPLNYEAGKHLVSYLYTDELGCSNLAEAAVEVVTQSFYLDGTELGTIRIYPNPNKGKFSIDLGNLKNEVIEISLYDISGRVIKLPQQQYSRQLIELEGLSDGIYFLRIEYNNQYSNHKIVVQSFL